MLNPRGSSLFFVTDLWEEVSVHCDGGSGLQLATELVLFSNIVKVLRAWIFICHLGGVVVLPMIGFASGPIPAMPLNLALLKGASLIGVFWGSWLPVRLWSLARTLMS